MTGGTFGDTDVFNGLVPVTVMLVGGIITITPEPGSMVLALFAATGLCAVVIRRRRKIVKGER